MESAAAQVVVTDLVLKATSDLFDTLGASGDVADPRAGPALAQRPHGGVARPAACSRPAWSARTSSTARRRRAGSAPLAWPAWTSSTSRLPTAPPRRTSPAPGPGVLLFIDAIGLRPQIEQMADRIASWGYTVLAPNTLYRSGTAAETSPAGDLRAPGAREEFFEQVGPRLARADPRAPGRATSRRTSPPCGSCSDRARR